MNKIVLITGAAKGIGRETALVFAKESYNLAINYNESFDKAKDLLNEIKYKYGNKIKVMIFKADVSKRSEVKSMINEINLKLGNIDVLINNAGIAQSKLFTDITESDWDNMFNVNVKGVFNCSQEVLPQMISNKKGKIINISSIWGMVGASCEVHYSATKGAIIAFTKALAKEEALSNIQINAVAPGAILTDMILKENEDTLKELKNEIPMGRLGYPNEIAELIYYLASEKANYITGQVISPNGGFVI